MATVVIPLSFKDANALPNLPFPTPGLEYANGAGVVANAFPFPTLTFADSVISAAFWQVPTAVMGAAPAPILYVDFYALTAIAGNVSFGVQVSAVAASAATLTEALATTATVVTPTVSGTLNGKIRVPITLANLDGLAAAVPTLYIKLFRDGTVAGDTTTGDIKVTQVAISYSDT